MQKDPRKRFDALLESSVPDLVRRQATQVWTKEWVGQYIESYRLESIIGTGAHGVVFRAHRTTPFERMVAVKLLPSLRGHANPERFQKECQALADLAHPNIAEILTAGVTEDGTPYLVMPYLLAKPIDAYADHRQGDWLRLAELMRQLAAAIAFAHQQGFMHCDLKPDNILVDDQGHLTVTDFGLAVRTDEVEDFSQRPSWAPGTLGYAAPELFTSKLAASPRVDIYSLGAVLYRLLTGFPPHESSGWLDSLVSTTQHQFTPVGVRNPHAPPALAEICERCLARDPDKRFSSVAEIERKLEAFLLDSSAPVSVWSRKPMMRILGCLAVVALVLAATLPAFLGSPSAKNAPDAAKPPRPQSLTDAEVAIILDEIEQQLLRPGVKDPAQPGDFEAVFITLQDAARELESLLERAPNNKQVRKSTATGYFLLGRAALWMKEQAYADQCAARSERMFRELHREYPEDGFMFDFFHTLIVQGTLAPPRETRDIHLHALGVITALRENEGQNLDYADAQACIYGLLAVDYSQSHVPGMLDLAKAETYAKQALDLARWTTSQPGTRPIHRKHIMTAQSLLSEMARMKGDLPESLRLAKLALVEAERLDQALGIADTKNELFDKTVKYAAALRNVGRLEEASVHAEQANELARQLRQLAWPQSEMCELWMAELRRSLKESLAAKH
jgi:serine/threonine protein kinase